MKSVPIKFTPLKLCVLKDHLWVAGGAKGVFIYDTNLEQQKRVTNKHFQSVSSVFRADKDVIVCAGDTGLHVLNTAGTYIKQICTGRFIDGSVTNNTLFGLEYAKQQIHLYTRRQNDWVKQQELDLSGYIEGFSGDRLCTSSNCIYVSCYRTHCVCVYSLTGEFLYKTGEWGGGEWLEAGKFYYPRLSDVDSEGNLMLCDYNNRRLQVFHLQTKQWGKIQGLEGLESPLCAGVGLKHLWVGTNTNKLLKYEAK